VRRARKGDREAFDELVRRTYLDTFALARRLAGNDEDARDIVQESYLRAYRAVRSFRGDARFSTWLYRITANSAATFHERRRRHPHGVLEEHAAGVADSSPERDPELRAHAALLRRDLDAALRRLPERLRHVLVLRELYDLPHEEIARALGITEGAAKVRLHRARRRLRDILDPAVGPVSPDPTGEVSGAL
jgi:RNA polymerase sigma-70 factor, ECF subfamily